MLATPEPADARDEVAEGSMVERIEAELARYDSGWVRADRTTIDSPLE